VSKAPTKPKSGATLAKKPPMPGNKEDAMFYDMVYNSSYPQFYSAQQQKYDMQSLHVEVDKRKNFEGCDWILELSIALRHIKQASVPRDE
jgi:hypothetical protein